MFFPIAMNVQHESPLETRFYLEPAAAYVRGTRPDLVAQTDLLTLQAGLDTGLRLHRFKRSRVLPRVRKVLGTLRSIGPEDLLDIGSGRGAFLWPLLDELTALAVTCAERNPERVRQLQAVARGGMKRLRAVEMDATHLGLQDGSFDVVTALEVLEHIEDVTRAVREITRVARRFVVVTVPSRPDDNPEHLHLLTSKRMTELFMKAGAKRVDIDAIHNHLIAVARLPWDR